MSKEDRQKRKEEKHEERQKRALELAEKLRSRLEEQDKARLQEKEMEDELNIFMCEECLSKITDIDDTFTIVTVPDGECDICHKREDNLYQVDMNHVHAK